MESNVHNMIHKLYIYVYVYAYIEREIYFYNLISKYTTLVIQITVFGILIYAQMHTQIFVVPGEVLYK